ncbi:MAG: NAD(P)H-dependent oxidoreductase [Chitinophagaceae bacterium]|nr:NAD(P)H-dependent oxidoreductase [Chitinophagaceae bacterium]
MNSSTFAPMYTIISATNRKGSNTLKVSKQYQTFFQEAGIACNLYSLEDFRSFEKDEAFSQIESDLLIPTDKFIFVMPEYNGSFPGIFKLMMDISDIKRCWNFKKVMLVGVANGRAGNLRGLDTMTNMCHYMKMNVYHDKLPLSSVSNELVNDEFVHEHTLKAIKFQIEGFIKF